MATEARDLTAVPERINPAPENVDLGAYKFGWHDPVHSVFTPRKGLSHEVVEEISQMKGEPEWMRKFRHKALDYFYRKPLPAWGGDLSGIDFDNIYYFLRATEKQAESWEDLPADIRNTYDRLGIPEAEKQRLIAGVAAQYESEVVYHKVREDLEAQGVIFADTDTALREHEDLFREHWATVIPPGDNKFASLNSAVWSGGCLTADAQVNVKGKGLVSIAEVEPGDEVFGADLGRNLQRGKVLDRMDSGVKPVYRIQVAGRTLEATANHQFLVARRIEAGGRPRWASVWVPLDEIEVGEPIAIARVVPDDGDCSLLPEPAAYVKNHSLQRLRFPRSVDCDLAWLFGLWVGDGHTATPDKHMRQVSFSVPSTDPVYPEAKRVVERLFDAHTTPTRCGFLVSSKAFGTWLGDLGFEGHAKTKRLPRWVYALPHEQQLALLGGLVDADGWTENGGATIAIELANRELLEDVRQLAIGCGLYADGRLLERTRTVTFADGHTATSTCWRLRIQGDLSRVGTRDPSKRGREVSRGRASRYGVATGLNFSSLATDTVGFATLREKQFIGAKPTYDIQVVGLENFVANGIVAHNSFIWVPEGVQVEIPLQAYFRINSQNMGQFERTLIIAEPGSSVHYVEGCLPAGELVATADGDHRPIETIRVGEHVLTHQGRPARVKAIQARDYRGPLYTFVPVSPDNAFRVTAEHPLLVVRREAVLVKRAPRNGWRPEVDTAKLRAAPPVWVQAKDVQEGDFLVFPKPKPAPARTVLPLAFARLAGYYLADGSASLTNGYPSLQFSLHIDDRDSVDEIRRLCKELYDAEGSIFWNNEKHEARVLVYTKAGYEAMRQHVGTRSHTKRLSADLLGQDETFLRNLVQAYLRGDGNTIIRSGATWLRAHTTSRILAFQLQAILARLGHYATVSLRRAGGPGEILGRQVVRHDIYQVQWTEGGRGVRQVRDCGDRFLVPVQRIQVEEFDGLVHNLDVEAPDSYLAGGFAVHNCTAPIYSSDSLHSAVVEIIVKPHAKVRYTTIQNWSTNVYNLVTKRAAAYEDATMEWIDGNIGCLTGDTQVFLNPRGPVAIKDVQAGDQLYAVDLQAMQVAKRRVNAVVCTGVRQVFKLTTENHREVRATANHPFLTLARPPHERTWRLEWRSLDSLQPGDLVAITDGLPGDDLAAIGERATPGGVEFVRVRSIEPEGEEPVYDIEVDGAHNFVANGLVVHNSKLTMKYPAVLLLGEHAHGEVLSVAFAGNHQHQDAGAKLTFAAPNTTGQIVSKSISRDGGRTSYRGLIKIEEGAEGVRANVRCDALLLDEASRSDTYPYNDVKEEDVTLGHEATVSKIGDDQLFYLRSRGLSEAEATAMIVRGFIEPVSKELPMEYALELNRLVALQMEGAVG